MPFRYTLWGDANRDHILANGSQHPERELYEEDVDDVVFGRPHANVVMDEYEMNGERRVDLVGLTTYDRVLILTVAPQHFDAARPVSARDATEAEARYYAARLKVKP